MVYGVLQRRAALPSTLLTFAPASSSNLTHSTSPLCAAKCRGVQPFSWIGSTVAPAARSNDALDLALLSGDVERRPAFLRNRVDSRASSQSSDGVGLAKLCSEEHRGATFVIGLVDSRAGNK